MTHSISRQPSVTSLDINPNCLSNISEHLEQGCDKILESVCLKNSKPSMRLDEHAKKILSERIIHLILALCSPNVPPTIQSFFERINSGLPGIDSRLNLTTNVLMDLRRNVEKNKKKQQLHLHSDRIYNVLKETYHRFDYGIYLYIVAILEQLLQRFLSLAIDYQQRMGVQIITGTAIQTLLDVYWTNTEPVQKQRHLLEEFVKLFPNSSYESCTKELQQFFLTQCIDQINLILRIFRQPIVDVYPNTGDLQTIFGCIFDLNVTLRILRDAIDDVFESETPPRCIAYCFLSMGEEHSLDDFVNYGSTVLSPECSTRLRALLENSELIIKIRQLSEEIKQKMIKAANKKDPEHEPWFHQCEATCPSDENIVCDFLVNSFRYLLPRLLLLPILHFLCLQHILDLLEHRAPNDTEKDILREALSMMTSAKSQLDRQFKSVVTERPGYLFRTEVKRLSFFIRTQQSSTHNVQVAKSKLESIDAMLKRGGESAERLPGRFEFIMEDALETRLNNKVVYVYLFTSWLMIYKHKNNTLSFKKKIPLNQFNVLDVIHHEDKEASSKEKSCPNSKFMFEIEYPDQKTSTSQKITFCASSYEQKCDWMATLLMIQTQKMFSRYLKELPSEEPPLKLPDPSVYRFSEEDSSRNILFDDNSIENSTDIPYIKAATLPKLVERITFHRYFDSKMLRNFLLVFRSFTTPRQLLTLLIERFNIPEPTLSEEELASGNADYTMARNILRRFNNTYKKRVQLRVLNALFNWIRDVAYYNTDFKKDDALQKTLTDFLDTVSERHLQSGVANIRRHMEIKNVESSRNLKHVFDVSPPPVINVIPVNKWQELSLTNVHPLEFARQVTLYEWELYKNIEYFEVTASETTKPEIQPNLYKLQDFSNKFKNWLVYSVVSLDCLEDRVVVLQRIIDLMFCFDQLNNLQGFQEAKGAIISASVYRMNHTLDALCRENRHYRTQLESIKKALDDTNDISTNEYSKKIRQIDPPAIPFIAIESRTRLIHINIKNNDYVTLEDGTQLINYRKFRVYGETVEYYLSFQKKPYNFSIEPKIREFLENLDPLKLTRTSDENSFEDYVFERSRHLEPKNINSEDLPQYESSLTPPERELAKQLAATPIDDIHKVSTVLPDARTSGNTQAFKNHFNTHPRSSTSSSCNTSTTSINTIGSTPSTLSRNPRNHSPSNNPEPKSNFGKQRTSSIGTGQNPCQRPSLSPMPTNKKQSVTNPLTGRPDASPIPVPRVTPNHRYSTSDSLVLTQTTSISPHFGSSADALPPRPPRKREMSNNSDASDTGNSLPPPPLPPRRSTHASPRVTPPPFVSHSGVSAVGQDNSAFSLLDEQSQHQQGSGDFSPSSLPPLPPRQLHENRSCPPLPPKPAR